MFSWCLKLNEESEDTTLCYWENGLNNKVCWPFTPPRPAGVNRDNPNNLTCLNILSTPSLSHPNCTGFPILSLFFFFFPRKKPQLASCDFPQHVFLSVDEVPAQTSFLLAELVTCQPHCHSSNWSQLVSTGCGQCKIMFAYMPVQAPLSLQP